MTDLLDNGLGISNKIEGAILTQSVLIPIDDFPRGGNSANERFLYELTNQTSGIIREALVSKYGYSFRAVVRNITDQTDIDNSLDSLRKNIHFFGRDGDESQSKIWLWDDLVIFATRFMNLSSLNQMASIMIYKNEGIGKNPDFKNDGNCITDEFSFRDKLVGVVDVFPVAKRNFALRQWIKFQIWMDRFQQ